MNKVYFGDIVREVKIKIDRANNPYEYYVAGDHMDTEELQIIRRGKFSEPPEPGPAFIHAFIPGQILYGSRRTYLKKVAVADFAGICANTTFVLETKDNNVFLQRLLPFLMYSERFTQYSINKSKGSTNPYILFSDLAKYEFNLPPLTEQQKLADLLWAANATREAYKKLLFATTEIVKSRFVEMFGDPVMNPMEWEVSTLKDVAIDKLSYGLGASASDYNGETRYVRITDITDTGELNNDVVSPSQYDDKYLLHDGDILFARSGATVGKTFRYSEKWGKCVYAGYLIRLIPNIKKVLPDYVFGYTKTDYYQEFVRLNQRTVAQPNINAQQYGDLVICIPPLSLQNRFAEFVQQADKSTVFLWPLGS